MFAVSLQQRCSGNGTAQLLPSWRPLLRRAATRLHPEPEIELAEMAEGLFSSLREATPTQSATAKLSSAPLPPVQMLGKFGCFAMG